MERLQIRSMESEDWVSVTLSDLSEEGALFFYEKDLRIGTPLDLKIDMSKYTPTINCVGKVAEIEQLQPTSMFCVAAKFTDIKEQDKKMIETTIEELSEKANQNFSDIFKKGLKMKK